MVSNDSGLDDDLYKELKAGLAGRQEPKMVVVIVFLVFEPRGLYHRWEVFKTSCRLHPYSYGGNIWRLHNGEKR